MQPKILVPTRAAAEDGRASNPIPDLIVKAGAAEYPGLAANEFLCLSAAARAGIDVPSFDLSDDGQLLLIDRFDVGSDGARLGFEDMASLMGLVVRDTLSDRKYHGSYEDIASVLKSINLPSRDLGRFFDQVAFSVMVRNGDGHLKNFGVLYSDSSAPRLSPMFDVVTTAIYRYARFSGGPEIEDNTLALKLFRGKRGSNLYPSTEDLLRFGRQVCGVERPDEVVCLIAGSLDETLRAHRTDERIPAGTLQQMAPLWDRGMQYAVEVAAHCGRARARRQTPG